MDLTPIPYKAELGNAVGGRAGERGLEGAVRQKSAGWLQGDKYAQILRAFEVESSHMNENHPPSG